MIFIRGSFIVNFAIFSQSWKGGKERTKVPLQLVFKSVEVAFCQYDIYIYSNLFFIFSLNNDILTPLHNIKRQNVKANKFILGRLGENQP